MAFLPVSLIIAILLPFIPNGNTCTCSTLSAAEAYDYSVAIFVGLVTSSEVVDKGILKAKIRVEVNYFGDLSPQIEALTVTDLCSNLHFQEEQRYLIYVYPVNKKKERVNFIFPNGCSRVLPLNRAKDDLAIINEKLKEKIRSSLQPKR